MPPRCGTQTTCTDAGGHKGRPYIFVSTYTMTALRGRRQALFPKRAWTKRGRRGDTPLLHFPQVRRLTS